jgi:predicted ATPase
MRIERFQVEGFLGRAVPIECKMNPDVNIVTGFNGSGKTNLLKLLWYTLSGNINSLLREVMFSSLEIDTDLYSVKISKFSEHTCHGWIKHAGKIREVEDIYDIDDDVEVDARDIFSQFLQEIGASLFFPTFRRIEGGFTIVSDEKPLRSPNALLSLGLGRPAASDLQKAVSDVSQRLTNKQHTFVTSISTIDISELLLLRYTRLSENSSKFQTKSTQEIISRIRSFRIEQEPESAANSQDASAILDEIAAKIEDIDRQRESTMAPFKAVTNLVQRIFRHKSIQINKSVSLGDAANAISSDLLSAGEKQMLSFICYNAFFDQMPIFIDEPELSLHVDWQRTLFPTLESQGTSNQFIIATHSPFIYSKYPEKEIKLASARGDEGDHA